MSDKVTIEITKLVNGGQGLGFYEGKPVFAWNTLPGETAVVQLSKIKKNFLEGTAVQIINSSPERISPEEDHFLSCSPWQIMKYDYENNWKKKIAEETFKKIANIELCDLEIDYDQNIFGYRNKIEYRFCSDKNGATTFALHKRGTNDKCQINTCLLAKENINKAAIEILGQININKISPDNLSSLILRQNKEGEVVASLNAVKMLRSYGKNFIIEELAGKTFKCSPLSFFQVNVDVFSKTISKINTFIDEDEEIVDFYSGVGSIGITLGDKVKSAVLVESNEESSKLARENIEANGLENFTVFASCAENMLSEIKKNKTIILDPPRAGLHHGIVNKLLEILPNKIIYLSCDAATQARDIKMLSKTYRVKFCQLYNFFPRTPHIESLIILERCQK